MGKLEATVPNFNYDDIINLPYPNNDWNFLIRHPRMSMEDRAKIFSPFAALRGHQAALIQTTEQKLNVEQDELMEDSRAELDENLIAVADKLNRSQHPMVKVTYFVQDKILAKGIGTYCEIEGVASKIDTDAGTLQVVEQKIPLDCIRRLLIL